MGESFVYTVDVDETTLNTEETISHWIADLKKEFGNRDICLNCK
jgi:hypothetical protein